MFGLFVFFPVESGTDYAALLLSIKLPNPASWTTIGQQNFDSLYNWPIDVHALGMPNIVGSVFKIRVGRKKTQSGVYSKTG